MFSLFTCLEHFSVNNISEHIHTFFTKGVVSFGFSIWIRILHKHFTCKQIYYVFFFLSKLLLSWLFLYCKLNCSVLMHFTSYSFWNLVKNQISLLQYETWFWAWTYMRSIKLSWDLLVLVNINMVLVGNMLSQIKDYGFDIVYVL